MSARLTKARAAEMAADIERICEASRTADTSAPGRVCYPFVVGALSVLLESLVCELQGPESADLIRKVFEDQRLKVAA